MGMVVSRSLVQTVLQVISLGYGMRWRFGGVIAVIPAAVNCARECEKHLLVNVKGYDPR